MSESIDYIACMDVRLSDVLAEMNNKHINIYEAMDALNISNEKDRKYLIHELKNKDIIHESFQIQNMKQEILSRSLKIDDAELNSFEMAIRSLDLMNDEDIIGFLNYCFETNISHKSKVYRIANRDYAYYDKDYYTYYVIINNNTYLFVIHSDKAPEVMSVIDYNMNVVPNCNQNEIESEIIGLYVPSPIVFYPKGSDDRVKKLELFLLWVYDDPFDCDVTHDFLNDYSFIEMINNFMYPLLPFYPKRYENILLNNHTIEDEKIIIEDFADAIIHLLHLQKSGTFTMEQCSHITRLMSRTFRDVVTESMKMKKFLNVDIMNTCILEYSIDFNTFKKCYDENQIRKETLLYSIYAVMETMKLAEEQAMDALKISKEDRNLLLPPKKPANTEE